MRDRINNAVRKNTYNCVHELLRLARTFDIAMRHPNATFDAVKERVVSEFSEYSVYNSKLVNMKRSLELALTEVEVTEGFSVSSAKERKEVMESIVDQLCKMAEKT